MVSTFFTNHKLLLAGAAKVPGLLAVGLRIQKTPIFSKLPIDCGTFSFLLASACTTFSPKFSVVDSRIEELAWTIFLQSSLVLGLWKTELEPRRLDSFVNVRRWIPILVVFLIGTIGSVTGGFVGFHFANSAFLDTSKTLSPDMLSTLSACLTASYIGGTVNFFETAKILGSATNESKKSLINLVAGVDIGVMICYFWFLGALRSSSIKSLFPRSVTNSPELPHLNSLTSITSCQKSSNEFISYPEKAEGYRPFDYLPSIMAASIVTSLANYLQGMIRIPGTSVIFATLGGVGSIRLLRGTQSPLNDASLGIIAPVVCTSESAELSPSRDSDSDRERISRTVASLQRTLRMAITLFLGNLREHCAGASVYMMGLFYTTVGLGFRLDQARTVSGPVGALIGATLVSHLCVILSGSLVWNFLVKSIAGFVSKMEVRSANSTTDSSQDLLIDLDTTIIASNACVGGAATAAQMASTMRQRAGGVNLMIAASTMGTLGYMIGTPIGLFLAKSLARNAAP